MARVFYIFISLLFLYGCQVIEEGEVDYVRTISNQGLSAKDLAQCNKELYDHSEFNRAGVTRECYETLYRKYTRVPQINSGDTISVHLMQAFNGFAIESRNIGETFGSRGANAEMVIIANVCEQGKGGCSMAFGPKSDKSGRVIFYSNGVKANQYLNFSFLPVYGPIEYEGGPLIIQIAIVELDDPSEQQKAMLKTLAATGQQMYPPASSALSVLDSIGSAILSNSSDDILFRYSMTLVPESNSENYQSPIIAEGNYAFVRKRTEKGPLEKEIFDNLMFDNLSGRLVEKCTEKENKPIIEYDEDGNPEEFDFGPCTLDLNTGEMYKDYRTNTYLTFQIKSGFVAKTLDNIQTFEMLMKDINEASDASALEAIEAISALKSKVSSKAIDNKLLEKLNNLRNTLSKVPNDQFDLFAIQVFELVDLYDSEVQKLDDEECFKNTATAECKNLLTKEQLTSLQMEVRSLLKSINPNPSKAIASMIPTGVSKLATPDDTTAAFESGYKMFFNKTILEQYGAELITINNLSDNIAKLKSANSPTEYVEQRRQLLSSQVRSFLNKLATSNALRTQLSCTSVTDKSCYLYLKSTDAMEVATVFNRYGSRLGLIGNKLDTTSDVTLAASLAPSKIDDIIKDILAALN
ncbi:hypothetical protein [Paraglaciecola sp. 2405UD69-4]|uniref:hypothetical protein n=1 Tax=Paraglaciecola sp. 2405UD69-4 TaxID=3391836 RepID=UPI0039C99B36